MYEQGSFEPVARVVQLASHIEQKRLADIAYETRRFVRIGESEETINQRIQDKSQPLINIYHYHCNHLGTPQELSDENGNIIWLSYDRAWGGSFDTIYKRQFIDNFAITQNELQPIKFQGQCLDVETGLHYNRFRYYDSDVGMFISRDPIGLMGGFNVFAYAPNPIGWIDPWGLAKKKCTEATENKPTKKEIEIKANSFEDARNKVINRLDELGFDWTSRSKHTGRLGLGKDRNVGFSGNTKNGDFARYRLDYDPKKGTHINLEVGKGDSAIKEAYMFKGDENLFGRLLRKNS